MVGPIQKSFIGQLKWELLSSTMFTVILLERMLLKSQMSKVMNQLMSMALERIFQLNKPEAFKENT